MKKIFPALACAMLLNGSALLCSCNFHIPLGNGIQVKGYSEEGIDFSEERDVKYFDSFRTDGPINVYYVKSDKRKVIVEGKEEFVKHAITSVKDETLIIELEKGKYTNLVLRVIVCAPDIEEMTTNGSGNIVAKDVTGKDLSFITRGSGDIIIENVSQCKDLEAETLGSGDIYIKSAQVSNDIELHTAGSGDIQVNGSCYKIEAKTMGSGDITGKLQYSKIEKKVYGSGKIGF